VKEFALLMIVAMLFNCCMQLDRIASNLAVVHVEGCK
jgi:hypothetical protein